jgi:hypothetical protein
VGVVQALTNIVSATTIPNSWKRRNLRMGFFSPFLKMDRDSNHGWLRNVLFCLGTSCPFDSLYPAVMMPAGET